MRLIVTRPPAQAAAWVAQLQALGLDAVALPLIGIAPVDDGALLQQAWATLADFTLVLFVSPNAVQQFFAWRSGAAWPAGTLAGSTGPGTSAALREAGVPEASIAEPAADAAQFDTEALWARLSDRDWSCRKVLIVRGEQGRDWFADTLRRHGAEVVLLTAYRRLAPRADAASAALIAAALAAPGQHLWLFSSSEAITHLQGLAPGADWSASRAAASHPRIVQSALAAGFGRVDAVAASPAALAELLNPPPIQSAPL